MKSKVIIYSTENGFFSKKGFFIFEKPIFEIRYKNNLLTINYKKIKTKNPIPIIEKILKKTKGYSIGYISYDFKENIYSMKKYFRAPPNLPLIFINVYKKYSFKKSLNVNTSFNKIFHIKYPDKNLFLKNVKKAKEYIKNGDIYQVNLSHRLEIEGFFYKEKIFQNLVEYQPTPYLMLIKDKEFSLISASMELFLEKKGKILKTKPIKGTRPRGLNKENDKNLYLELKNSEKEKAENLMITDLMRNDIAKISENTTVRVEKLFDIEKYNTIYQMVSTVKSKIKKDISFKEIIFNTFPPGSITGAPKIRAMQIIDELEKNKRGIYCGSTFVITPNMDFTMSVAIRQSIFEKDKCYIYVGAGIVSDSIPEKEFEETILKSKANIKILE